MYLQLKAWRKPAFKQSALVIPWQDVDPVTNRIKEKGHLKFTKLKEYHEVPDAVGYGILRTHADMLQQVVLKNNPAQTKTARSPANK